MRQKTENRKPITVKLFSVPISIINKSQALALIGEWVREYHSVIGSRSIGHKQTNRKLTDIKLKTDLSAEERAMSRERIVRGAGEWQAEAGNRKPITGYPKIITTPNPEIIVAAQSDPEFLKALQSADLSIPDGIGVAWALKIRRLSGLDLMESLILQAQKVQPFEAKLKIMLLGGRPGVAQAAAASLRRPSSFVLRPSAFKIRALSGPPDIQKVQPFEAKKLVEQINSFQPDLLFVAFGHPKQEKWLTANRESLTVGVAMAVGGALDQIADPSLRPPPYINSIWLGWLYRLLRQPWRWRRQLALLKFVWMVIKDRILEDRR